MSKKLKQMLAAYGLVLPSFLTVMLVVAWPILTAIKTSFTDPDTGGFTFDNYKYFFETPRELTNILFTLGIVFLTVALAIVLAYLLALYLRFVKSKVSRLIGNLYLLPRFVPSMVAVYAMLGYDVPRQRTCDHEHVVQHPLRCVDDHGGSGSDPRLHD